MTQIGVSDLDGTIHPIIQFISVKGEKFIFRKPIVLTKNRPFKFVKTKQPYWKV